MKTFEANIDFKKLSSNEFEELCFELLLKYGFSNLIWKQGGADDGRDIEGELAINNSLLGEYREKYFFECKNFTKGVPPEKLNSKIAWADSENPQHLVFIISSYLTNSGINWLEKIKSQKKYRIHVIDGKKLLAIVLKYEDLIQKYFIKNKYKVLLNETIKNWIIHSIDPAFQIFNELFSKFDLNRLTIHQKIFLYVHYYVNYSELERGNTSWGSPHIEDGLKILENGIKYKSNFKGPVLVKEKYIDDVTGGV
mgnify:CR=1 FL=1